MSVIRPVQSQRSSSIITKVPHSISSVADNVLRRGKESGIPSISVTE